MRNRGAANVTGGLNLKKEGMTGAMSRWLDTSKPAPVRMKPAVEYFEPTSQRLVAKLINQVKAEKGTHRDDMVSRMIARLRRAELEVLPERKKRV